MADEGIGIYLMVTGCALTLMMAIKVLGIRVSCGTRAPLICWNAT